MKKDMESDLAKQVAQKQITATGNWFARTNAKADRQQYKQLTKQYGQYGDVTYDQPGRAWVLGEGAPNPGKATINGRPAIPSVSSTRKLQ